MPAEGSRAGSLSAISGAVTAGRIASELEMVGDKEAVLAVFLVLLAALLLVALLLVTARSVDFELTDAVSTGAFAGSLDDDAAGVAAEVCAETLGSAGFCASDEVAAGATLGGDADSEPCVLSENHSAAASATASVAAINTGRAVDTDRSSTVAGKSTPSPGEVACCRSCSDLRSASRTKDIVN